MKAVDTTERKMVRTSESCDGCGRNPYTRRDGTEYLYEYDGRGPVCSPRCARKLEARAIGNCGAA